METASERPQDYGPEPSHYNRREEVLTQVIMSLPELLAKCEEYGAAAIVAGLLKAHMTRRAPDTGPADDLDAIVNRVMAGDGAGFDEDDD